MGSRPPHRERRGHARPVPLVESQSVSSFGFEGQGEALCLTNPVGLGPTCWTDRKGLFQLGMTETMNEVIGTQAEVDEKKRPDQTPYFPTT